MLTTKVAMRCTPTSRYLYLTHSCRKQFHYWISGLQKTFEQCATAMFGYMTELEYVEMTDKREIEAEGHDMLSLLFHFLDEFLFVFCDDPFFIVRKVQIIDIDCENFRINARGYGEEFKLGKHPQGTEVKAITYSNMQIHDNEDQHEVFVIIDI
ncbi:hypothetical protein PR048_005706 [Dryococelus australis]|uniref:Archease domain-containing protein n=1 Tax=Dryococelus australis TaxID=614101 RepID=A0ABQ9IB36_9NEOP|nr:hypothetical protein PR048_005706 [Dryococelus australis]